MSEVWRLMAVALTAGQWRASQAATETGPVFGALKEALGVNLEHAVDPFARRESIAAVLRPWFSSPQYAVVCELLTKARVLWSPYRDIADAARRSRQSAAPLVCELPPGIGEFLGTGSPIRWNGAAAGPTAAPMQWGSTPTVCSLVSWALGPGDLTPSRHEGGRPADRAGRAAAERDVCR